MCPVISHKLKSEATHSPNNEMPLPLIPLVFAAHFAHTVTTVITAEARRKSAVIASHFDSLRLQVRGPEHSFTPFSRLPAELRLKIWNHALPPRTLLATHAPNPALLSVNREARYEALRRYTLVRLNTWGDRRIYIDFNHDSIAIVEGKGGGGFPVRGARHVIVVCEEPFRSPASWLKCRYRSGLDSITLVLGGATRSNIVPFPEIKELGTPSSMQTRLGLSKEEAERIEDELRDLAQGWGHTEVRVGEFV
ncbi:uncharacterized protein CTRU02_201570 [Colletotrichum truncatum]|uniref:Uncharacterized protein n=1 Tax=Colletotrichum truncatum TaxID=5467 RepID=A0ACC3ZIB1_COLTU|nr:uncharacterized protein CTRU02_10796 [Colletotrichum truncatum]KAF6786672.1 hypothetical protein CTRU02_10796 [Colletotrichum truncatum]